MTHETKGHRRARRWGRTAAIVALTVAVVVPVTAYAANTFTDVPDSNVFHDDIQWMSDNGVTAGCNPPANDKYCPKGNVTREQMGAFMRRLAENRVVDADTVDGKDASAFLGKTAKAADADELDGENGTYYANPIAMASGTEINGTDITADGEVARLTLKAPGSGDVIARLTGTWGDNNTDYTVVMWIEPHRSGSECDTYLDGDALPGTIAATSSVGGTLTATSTVSAAGAGTDKGVAAGTHRYSVCHVAVGAAANNVDWSGSVEWRHSGASTAALTHDATAPSAADVGSAFPGH